jgi:hypothetical protein
MFETPPEYPAFYVPAEHDRDDAIRLGVKWLLSAQGGPPLVLFHAKKMVSNNRLLEAAITQYRIPYTAPVALWRDGWRGGPVLAPWAPTKVLTTLDDEMSDRLTGVCVLGWTPGAHDTWIRAHHAVDLTSGVQATAATIRDPVVLVAMEHAGRAVNHNNVLVQTEDRAYMILTLRELVRAGHRFDVEEIAAWALAQGWPGREVDELRDLAAKVLRGHRFQVNSQYGPMRGSAARWADEASERGLT